jgi:transposase
VAPTSTVTPSPSVTPTKTPGAIATPSNTVTATATATATGWMDDRALEEQLFGRRAVMAGPARAIPARPQPDWTEVHRELRRPHVTLQLPVDLVPIWDWVPSGTHYRGIMYTAPEEANKF